MTKTNVVVSEVKDFEELKAMIKNDQRDEMRAALGTTLSPSADSKLLHKKYNEMLPKIAIWKENWEVIHTAILPELETIEAELAQEKLEALANLAPSVKQKILAALQSELEPAA